MELSKRLEAIVSFVDKGCTAADVGTDHGYVPITLIRRGIVDTIIAMDVKPGPLKRAQEHVEQMNLSEWIDIRLSDGLDQLVPGEVDTVMMSGMGGYLIIQLLHRGQQVLKNVQTLILSPQSATAAVRKYIMKIGFTIVKEVMVEDDGKFYTVIKASRVNDCEASDGLTDDSAADGTATNGTATNGSASNKQAVNGSASNRPAAKESASNRSAVEESASNRSAAKESASNRPAAKESASNRPAAKESESNRSAVNGSVFNRSAANEPEAELFLQYGQYLLETKDPVTRKYLQKRKDNFVLIKEKYLDKSQSLSGQRRLLELEKEIAQIERALGYFQDKEEGNSRL